MFDDNVATGWKTWKKAWKRFEVATGVYRQDGVVRVSTLLSIIGEDGVKTFDTFTWDEDESEDNIEHVLKKFDEYCEPRTQVIYERYRFNNRKQEQGENVSTYLTELRTIARNCDHESITPDEILRDRLVLGIRDEKVRERLLRTDSLTLKKAVEIIKAAEQTQQQVKLMTSPELLVNSIKENREDTNSAKRNRHDGRGKGQISGGGPSSKLHNNCGNCGRSHGRRNCPAFGKKCRSCGKPNHFEKMCRSKNVSFVEESDSESEDSYVISAISKNNKKKSSKAKTATTKLYINKKGSS